MSKDTAERLAKARRWACHTAMLCVLAVLGVKTRKMRISDIRQYVDGSIGVFLDPAEKQP